MDGPLARQAGNERRVSSFCTVYATYVTSSADRAVHTGLCRRRAAHGGGGSDPRRPTSKVLERDWKILHRPSGQGVKNVASLQF